jgi:hypothetical protein
MTDRLLERVRESGRFSRVLGTAEIDQVMTLEQRRQLMNCDATSCVLELAGALDVNLLLQGSLGKVGELYTASLKITDARSGNAVAAVTRTMEGTSEAVLLNQLDSMADSLLLQLDKVGAAPPPASAAPAPPAPANTAIKVTAWALGASGAALTLLSAAVLAAGLGVGLVANENHATNPTTASSALGYVMVLFFAAQLAVGVLGLVVWLPAILVGVLAHVQHAQFGVWMPWIPAAAAAGALVLAGLASVLVGSIAVTSVMVRGSPTFTVSDNRAMGVAGLALWSGVTLFPMAAILGLGAAILGSAALVAHFLPDPPR